MTELLYLSDSYLREFDASVLEVSEQGHVRLDSTAFYPGGGGQPFDCGTLADADNKWDVVGIVRQENVIWHVVDSLVTPSVGQTVKGIIDWELRYKLMRTHTAMHILCGVVWRDYSASVTGGNMSPLRGRMDFEFHNMSAELIQEIEEKINIEVKASRDIVVETLPREEAFQIVDLIRTKINLLPKGIKEVRTVKIVGLDLQADGGTHVSNTSEVGAIKIVDYKSKGRINKRIVVEIGTGNN
jgi:misacylated tRNA(Ala) deacylase